LHKGFACLSPVFVALGSVLCIAAAAPRKTAAETAATAAVRRQSASMQFARAEEQRAALNSKATEKRTLADYKQVVTGYRRVALITPRASEVPDSLLAVAELYTEMGDRFGRSYYQSAADSYQFLVREYPTSRYCQDATLRAAKLQRDQLGDSALAKKTYEDFLKRYPRSPRKREAQEALAELALLQNGDAPSATNNVALNSTAAPPASEEVRANAPVHSGGKSVGRPGSREIPRLRMIRADANGDTARVTIDLEDSVQYASGRIANPERIFFDLHAARLTPEVARGNVHVDGGLLTAVRVAQNHEGVVRVVLDVNGVKEYSASLTNNPPRLSIDLYGNSQAAPMRAAKGKRGQEAVVEDSNESAVAASEVRTVQNAAPNGLRTDADSASEQPAENSKSVISSTISGGAINGSTTGSSAIHDSGAVNNSSAVARNSLPGAKSTKSKSIKATTLSAKPDFDPAGERSTTHARWAVHADARAGLKDWKDRDRPGPRRARYGNDWPDRVDGKRPVPGRGAAARENHRAAAAGRRCDLYAFGRQLCPAGRADEHREPGQGGSVYFDSCEFEPGPRGARHRDVLPEPEGLGGGDGSGGAGKRHCAGRRSRAAGSGDEIARTEKIDESKELAEDIQDSLSKRIQKAHKPMKNRGVRKAPFVVLIGADMPSILTEISFLSNPADEQMLKSPSKGRRWPRGCIRAW